MIVTGIIAEEMFMYVNPLTCRPYWNRCGNNNTDFFLQDRTLLMQECDLTCDV